VPVEAEGVVPKVILSKAALDFGSKVARRALQGGKSPYVFEVQLRNNTDTPLQVAVGPPAAVVAFQKPSSSHGVAHADASKKPGTRVDEAAASSAYAVEGWDTRPSAQFFSIGPDEDVSFVVRFSPTEARLYEACVPVFLDGDKSAPYMLVQLSGTGTLPRLTFNVAECVLPVVSFCYVRMNTPLLASPWHCPCCWHKAATCRCRKCAQPPFWHLPPYIDPTSPLIVQQ
jgi:hypothetical protein